MNEEPRAWMRRWAYDRDDGKKGARPKHWSFQPVTLEKMFDDDVPLFVREEEPAA